jgi:DNA-binding transcriptional MerR regulator
MFKIGDFSKICRVPVSALRYYADIGLLQPANVDPFTNYRYYSLDQLPRLNRILALKDLGLSLEEIGEVLRDDLPAEQVRGMLRLKQAEAHQQVAEAQRRLAQVEARLRLIEKEGSMPEQEAVIKSIEPMECLSIREIAPTPEYVGMLLGESAQAVIGAGAMLAGAPFVIFHDKEFKPADMDIEVVFPLAQAASGEVPLVGGRAVKPGRLPGIEMAACILHMGAYDDFPKTYAALGRWIEANGYQISGPSREVYLRPPDDPGGAITEIQFPVAKER